MLRASLPVFVIAAACTAGNIFAQAPNPGKTVFENRCSGCHGADGNGGELGPPIAIRVPNLTNDHISTVVRSGLPGRGMPANNVSDTEMPQLVAFLRTLTPRETGFRP